MSRAYTSVCSQDCASNPCQSGSTCIDGDRAYTCACANACFSGFTCAVLNFAGFYGPVDNFPAANTIKAGSAVPLKFSLGCDMSLNIFAPPKGGALWASLSSVQRGLPRRDPRPAPMYAGREECTGLSRPRAPSHSLATLLLCAAVLIPTP